MLRLSLIVVAGALLVPVGRALAEDEAAPKTGLVIEHVDLSAWVVPEAVRGPVLAAPSDLVQGDGRHGTTWALTGESAPGNPRPVWLEFEGADPNTPLGFNVDMLIDTAKARGLPDERARIQSDGPSVVLQGPAASVAEMRAGVEWSVALMTSSVPVRGTLLADGREPAVRAQGSATCRAGHWTRLWLQEQRTPYVVDMEVEIAQASTMSNPYEAELPEGQEAYVRWFPGETASLLEVWTGELEHLDATTIDFSPVRGVPEGSGHGTVRLPRTAINRAYTALLLPAAGPSTHDITWQGLGGPRRLRLTVDGAPPAVAPVTPGHNPGLRMAALRMGAGSSGLLFASRRDRMDHAREELSALTEAAGVEGWVNQDPHLGGVAVISGPQTLLETYRAHTKRREGALRSGTLKVRVLTVPEESVRAPFAQGTLAVGAALPEGLAERLRSAGSVEGEGVSIPLTTGVKGGFRCGASVAGFTGFDVEVAQEAGCTDPLCGAMFHGLAGEALVSSGAAGFHVALDALVQWADPKAGTLTTTFRAPVGMAFNRDKVGPEPTDARHPVFPLLGGGGGEIHAAWNVAPKEGGERLLGVLMRGADALLILGSFTTP